MFSASSIFAFLFAYSSLVRNVLSLVSDMCPEASFHSVSLAACDCYCKNSLCCSSYEFMDGCIMYSLPPYRSETVVIVNRNVNYTGCGGYIETGCRGLAPINSSSCYINQTCVNDTSIVETALPREFCSVYHDFSCPVSIPFYPVAYGCNFLDFGSSLTGGSSNFLYYPYRSDTRSYVICYTDKVVIVVDDIATYYAIVPTQYPAVCKNGCSVGVTLTVGCSLSPTGMLVFDTSCDVDEFVFCRLSFDRTIDLGYLVTSRPVLFSINDSGFMTRYHGIYLPNVRSITFFLNTATLTSATQFRITNYDSINFTVISSPVPYPSYSRPYSHDSYDYNLYAHPSGSYYCGVTYSPTSSPHSLSPSFSPTFSPVSKSPSTQSPSSQSSSFSPTTMFPTLTVTPTMAPVTDSPVSFSPSVPPTVSPITVSPSTSPLSDLNCKSTHNNSISFSTSFVVPHSDSAPENNGFNFASFMTRGPPYIVETGSDGSLFMIRVSINSPGNDLSNLLFCDIYITNAFYDLVLLLDLIRLEVSTPDFVSTRNLGDIAGATVTSEGSLASGVASATVGIPFSFLVNDSLDMGFVKYLRGDVIRISYARVVSYTMVGSSASTGCDLGYQFVPHSVAPTLSPVTDSPTSWSPSVALTNEPSAHPSTMAPTLDGATLSPSVVTNQPSTFVPSSSPTYSPNSLSPTVFPTSSPTLYVFHVTHAPSLGLTSPTDTHDYYEYYFINFCSKLSISNTILISNSILILLLYF